MTFNLVMLVCLSITEVFSRLNWPLTFRFSSVENIVLVPFKQLCTLTQFGYDYTPRFVLHEQLIELRLVVSTAATLVNLLQGFEGGERGFIRPQSHDRSKGLVKLMDVHSSLGSKFFVDKVHVGKQCVPWPRKSR